MDNIVISKSFTGVTVGQAQAVKHGDAFTYSVSGTFAATLHLQVSRNGGMTWELVRSFTAAATGRVDVELSDNGYAHYRFACVAFTSGTAVTSITEVSRVLGQVRDQNGNVLVQVDEGGVSSLVRKSQRVLINAAGRAKVGATAGFVVAAADDLALVTCPAAQTASTLVIPLPSFKVGSKIKAFNLVGQIESAGATATVDAALRKLTAAAADVADALVGAITQLSVVADTIISQANSEKSALAEVVGEDETFYILVTVTTAAATDVALQGVVVEIEEA